MGDSAEGKGGRRTPSRLAPDPFVKGTVKDTSKDPVGGATGGGKQSGAGGEGLQGPVSDRPQQDLGRLAGRQASLRNKAEGLDLKFEVLRFHHVDLGPLVEQMAAIEQDLKAGLPRNAMRRREVLLQGLGQARAAMKGEVDLRRDETPNLPGDVQKELVESLQEHSPAGWEELNRRYFDRLGRSPGAATTEPGR